MSATMSTRENVPPTCCKQIAKKIKMDKSLPSPLRQAAAEAFRGLEGAMSGVRDKMRMGNVIQGRRNDIQRLLVTRPLPPIYILLQRFARFRRKRRNNDKPEIAEG